MRNRLSGSLPNLALAAVLSAYFMLAVGYSLSARANSGPDERYHVDYIREIALKHRLPDVSDDPSGNIEAHQPPLYYALQSVPYLAARSSGASENDVLLVLRVVTALLGSAWVYLLYRLSAEFFGERRPYSAILAAGFLSLLPMSVYIGGVVNNDAASMLSFTAAMWLIVRAFRRHDASRRSALLIGIASGLAILSKTQGLVLIPVVFFAALLMVARKNGTPARRAFSNSLLSSAVSLALAGPWFVRNLLAYHTPIPHTLYQPWTADLGPPPLVLLSLYKFFWIPWWTVGYFLDSRLYVQATLSFCMLAFVGVILHLYKCRGESDGEELDGAPGAWLLLTLPWLLTLGSVIAICLYRDNGLKQQGRLLLPSAAVLGIAVADGFRAFIQSPALRVTLGLLLIVALVAANVAVMETVYIVSRTF